MERYRSDRNQDDARRIITTPRVCLLLDVYAKALRAPKRAAAEKLQATLDAAARHAPRALPKLMRPKPIRP
jgi:hypothetical protein